MLTLEALDADVCPQSHHLPLITTARVFFLKPDNITEFNFQNHFLIEGESQVIFLP